MARGLAVAGVLAAALFLPAGALAAGGRYYVAPWGDDRNPGTRERPWASPGLASRRLRPGDTLVLLGGRYRLRRYPDDVLAPPSGTPGAWVRILGEPGRRPVLVGGNNLLTAIDLSGARYVWIENLEIAHDDRARGKAAWFRDGLEILGRPAAHIVLKDLYIHHVDEFGMNIQDVRDLTIENCRVEYAGFGALGGPAGRRGGWREVTVRGCTLAYSGHYYRGGDGADRPYDRPDGLGVEPSEGPIVIEDSVVAHNLGDGIDAKARRTLVRRTVVANNRCDGVKLWGMGSRVENALIYGRGDGDPTVTPWAAIVIDQVREPHARFEIVNVTVDDALGKNYLVYVQYRDPIPVRVLVRNTIFAGRGENSPVFVGAAGSLVADHNLFYLPKTPVVLTHGTKRYTCAHLSSLGEGNRCGDPRFFHPAWGRPGDYHLRPGSPAIDAGDPRAAPREDLEGRPRDARPDIGAYEYR